MVTKKLISKPYGIYILVLFTFINVLYTHLNLLELSLFTISINVNTQLVVHGSYHHQSLSGSSQSRRPVHKYTRRSSVHAGHVLNLTQTTRIQNIFCYGPISGPTLSGVGRGWSQTDMMMHHWSWVSQFATVWHRLQ